MRRRAAWGIAGAVFLAAAVAGLGVHARNRAVTARLAEARKSLRDAAVAVSCRMVDNCGDYTPGAGNFLSAELTTPISYLAALPADPFSAAGETFRYYQQKGAGNGTTWVIASLGPDGDRDLDRLPDRLSVSPTFPILGVAEFKRRNRIEPYKVTEPNRGLLSWDYDVEYAIMSDGRRVEPERIDLRFLPLTPEMYSSGFTWEMLFEHFKVNGIAIYDPTNGLFSDGDLIWTNAEDGE